MTGNGGVLVVGAGPTGLALAAFLHAHGVRPRVIDRGLDRARESRALAIQPRTLEVLAGLGVTQHLVGLGNKNVKLRLHASGRTHQIPMYDLGLADTAYPYLLFLSQTETERVLGEHLAAAGIEVQRGTELTELTQDADQAIAVVRHQDGRIEPIKVSYVVGCDGAHSSVRDLARIPFEGGSYPQTFVLADLEADGIEPGAAHVFLSGQGMLFFFPLVHPASWRLLAMRPRHDVPPGDAALRLDEVQALADAYTGATVRLRDPVWMTNFRLQHRAAKQYRHGRLFVAGDAAHIHSPAGAQGMNTGIQDAANLGWKLAHWLNGISPPSILDTYDIERAPIGRAVLRMSDRAFTIATSTNPLIRFARARVVPALIPLALRASKRRGYLIRTVSQLAVNYRHSPLSLTQPGIRTALRAGDRLPDRPVSNGLTLHQLTAAAGWHLLTQDTTRLPPSLLLSHRNAPITVHDLPSPDDNHKNPARRATTAGIASVILVRPDGHIGYVGNLAGLRSYLDTWLPMRP